MIRKIEQHELKEAINLSLQVCMQCGMDDFDDEGIETFRSFIHNRQLMAELIVYGAFEDNKLIGILGTKNNNKHISLFFILPEYHRNGIGKALFDTMVREYPVSEITVNSSTYAVPFYKSLGFEQIGGIDCNKGITSVPMKRISLST